MPISRPVSCLPGVFRYGNPQNRIHVTEKPLQLMKDVIQICEPGGRILDPFAGAGTTILAAVEEGYEAVGIEVTDAYYKLGSDRVKFALEAKEKKKARNNKGIHMDVQIYFRRRKVHPYGCRKGVRRWNRRWRMCCPEEESRVKVQRYCRKIYELGYVPFVRGLGFCHFWMKGKRKISRHITGCPT